MARMHQLWCVKQPQLAHLSAQQLRDQANFLKHKHPAIFSLKPKQASPDQLGESSYTPQSHSESEDDLDVGEHDSSSIDQELRQRFIEILQDVKNTDLKDRKKVSIPKKPENSKVKMLDDTQ